jgi:DNA-directed RNA polymerase subunit RPC12/RpoP
LNENYTVARNYCPIDNFKCDNDHHSHYLCDYCNIKINKYWDKKNKKNQIQYNKNQIQKNKEYQEQQKINNWIENETIKKYNQYCIINNKFKISLAHKNNYQLEFLNRELGEKIKKIREEWIFANEYNFQTNERPTKNTHPYHCSRCLRPLKKTQTNQLLNKISCNSCVDIISYNLYYNI